MPDPSVTRLRCVHCHTTETPLWRTGPDGPRSLCNACGVRFKKGKLVLYKDDQGNLTAIKRLDSLPVHVPPPAKKLSKRTVPTSSSPRSPSSPVELPSTTDIVNSSVFAANSTSRRTLRKTPSEAINQQSNHPVLVKKPRSRARRANAGQLPGRYASSQFSVDSQNHSWRSPTDSPASSPSSPTHSPRISDRSTILTSSSSLITDDFTPQQRNPVTEEDHLFSDMACLGLDGSADPDNITLLSMPADPCSAEQFTFAFSGLGKDACLAFDTPDRAAALRALLLDRTRNVSHLYDSTVRALCRLYDYHEQQRIEFSVINDGVMEGEAGATTSTSGQGRGSVDYCKEFVRSLALSDTYCGLDGMSCSSTMGDFPIAQDASEETTSATFLDGCSVQTLFRMLPEKTLHCAAIEKLRDLVDSSELVGFAETCLIELLAEDVSSASCRRRLLDFVHLHPSLCVGLAESEARGQSSIPTPA